MEHGRLAHEQRRSHDVLGERPGAAAVAGAALVLAGLAVLALRFERRFGPAGRAAEAPA